MTGATRGHSCARALTRAIGERRVLLYSHGQHAYTFLPGVAPSLWQLSGTACATNTPYSASVARLRMARLRMARLRMARLRMARLRMARLRMARA